MRIRIWGLVALMAFASSCHKKEDDWTWLLLLLAAGGNAPGGSVTQPPTTLDGYRWVPTSATYTPLVGGTTILSGAGSGCGPVLVALPFSFTYLGTVYSSIRLGVTGVATFYEGGSCVGDGLAHDNTLVPWGGPTIDDATSSVQYGTEGAAPDRVFVVQWESVKDSSYNHRYTFQLRLHETSNRIEFHYGPRASSNVNMYDTHQIGISNASAGYSTTNNVIEGKTGARDHGSAYRAGDFPPIGTVYRFTYEADAVDGAGFDPLFPHQWHLLNRGQYGGTAGEDVNLQSVWDDGNRGEGVVIAVVDDGMAINHEDLSTNVLTGQSYDYVYGGTDPSGSAANHGTCVAGVAAARDGNGLGGRGAAPRASLLSYNLLQSSTDAHEADAMTRNIAGIHISNNSWGPADGYGNYSPSPAVWKAGIETGLSTGRGGLGTVYVWAAGNGGTGSDDSNYDGYANHHGVVAVCAVGDRGKRASYSETGANLWVCAPSQGDSASSTGTAITTTDNVGTYGYNVDSSTFSHALFPWDADYTNNFNGTSSASPLAGGVIALVMKANPNLTWRDIKLILAQSARKNDATDGDWATNAAGYHVNHKYGFGTIDAAAAVALAKTWTNVGPQLTHTASDGVSNAIPDNNTTGLTRTIPVSGSGISKIEFVEITVNSTHTWVGDLEFMLTGPDGTVSILSNAHTCYVGGTGACGGGFSGSTWTFGSARHLGGAANGTWTLRVRDLEASYTGNLVSWSLKFYGR